MGGQRLAYFRYRESGRVAQELAAAGRICCNWDVSCGGGAGDVRPGSAGAGGRTLPLPGYAGSVGYTQPGSNRFSDYRGVPIVGLYRSLPLFCRIQAAVLQHRVLAVWPVVPMSQQLLAAVPLLVRQLTESDPAKPPTLLPVLFTAPTA